MSKVFFILFSSSLISMIFCQTDLTSDSPSDLSSDTSSEISSSNDKPLVRCLQLNSGNRDSLSLSSCTTFNEGRNIEKQQNEIYCCFLKITYEKKREEKYCMTTVGELDKIDERKEILRFLSRNITDISIDCSAKYLEIISLVSILILILF